MDDRVATGGPHGPGRTEGRGEGGSWSVLQEYFRLERRRRATGGIVSLAALGVILGFAGICYRTARENFSEARVRAAAKVQAEDLFPQLSAEASGLLDEVGPAYVTAGKSALSAALPELQTRIQKELTALADNLSAKTRARLGSAFVASAEVLQDELRRAFPNLHDETVLDRRVAALEKGLRAETERALEAAAGSYGPSQARLVATLAKFPRLEGVPDHELQRRFVHLWLLLLDHELMEGATPETRVDAAEPSAETRTRKG